MKLQVIRIADRGVVNSERLHLSVLQETNLSFYAVLLSRYMTPTGVASGNLTSFWFPAQPVKPGDQVVLSSCSGTPNARKEPNGTTTHFYYWGLPNAVWNDPPRCAVVLEVINWGTTPQGG
jgi:hypothetical protein